MAALQTIRFDTADVPGTDQFELWRRGVVGFELERLDDPAEPFHARVTGHGFGEFALVNAALGSAMRFAGAPGPAQPRNFTFVLIRSGSVHGDADGRDYAAGAGQLIVFDWRRPVRADLSASETLALILPQAALEAESAGLPDLHGRVVDGVAGRLLTNALQTLAHELDGMSEADPALSRTTIRMIAACLAGLPAAETAEEPLLGPAIRRRLARLVDERIALPELSPASLARDLGVSRATLYRALAASGGVAGYVRTRRLEAAHAALGNREDPRSVKAIAAAHGFSSPSQFNTAFRRRFGYRPLDVRSGSLANAVPDEGASPEQRLHAMVRNLPGGVEGKHAFLS